METIENIHYLRVESEASEPENYYIVHDNCMVYNEFDECGELWKMRKGGGELFLFPHQSCKVYNKFTTKKGKLMINDSVIPLKNLSTLELWIKTERKDIFLENIKESRSYLKENREKWEDSISQYKRDGVPYFTYDIYSKTIKFSDMVEKMEIKGSEEKSEQKSEEREEIKTEDTTTSSTHRKIKQFLKQLPDNFPQLEYKCDSDRKGLYHRGQLKLLCSEIEFLTMFTTMSSNYLVIYAGAASGYHITLLSEMFPNCRFILFDPAKFKIPATSRIMIRNECFTEKIVEEFKGDKVLFISDIRSIPRKRKDKDEYLEEFESHVLKNMIVQLEWIQSLNTIASMLKFRLPYKQGRMNYPDSNIYFQAWAPETSTETRIIIKEEDKKTLVPYHQRKYEEQMFYFNKNYRRMEFYDIHPFFGKVYDSLREYQILKQYLEENDISIKENSEKEIDNKVYRLMYSFDLFLYGDKNEKHVTQLLMR